MMLWKPLSGYTSHNWLPEPYAGCNNSAIFASSTAHSASSPPTQPDLAHGGMLYEIGFRSHLHASPHWPPFESSAWRKKTLTMARELTYTPLCCVSLRLVHKERQDTASCVRFNSWERRSRRYGNCKERWRKEERRRQEERKEERSQEEIAYCHHAKRGFSVRERGDGRPSPFYLCVVGIITSRIACALSRASPRAPLRISEPPSARSKVRSDDSGLLRAATVLANRARTPCPGEPIWGRHRTPALKLLTRTRPTGTGLNPADPPRNSGADRL